MNQSLPAAEALSELIAIIANHLEVNGKLPNLRF
jgi:hypothetical protein